LTFVSSLQEFEGSGLLGSVVWDLKETDNFGYMVK
jgi:hypothetical protein